MPALQLLHRLARACCTLHHRQPPRCSRCSPAPLQSATSPKTSRRESATAMPTPRSSRTSSKRVDDVRRAAQEARRHAADAAEADRPEADRPHQRALGKLIQAGAQDGEAGRHLHAGDAARWCGRCSRPIFRRQGRRADQVGDPGQRIQGNVKLTVNGRYPDDSPLSTMPPQVLQTLPKLPEELEYRFVRQQPDPVRSARAHHRRLHGARLQVEVRRTRWTASPDAHAPLRLAAGLLRRLLAVRRSPRWSCRAAAAQQPRRRRCRCPTSPTRCTSPSSATTAPATSRQYEIGAADGDVVRPLRVPARGDDGRQHLRLRPAAGLRQEVRGALQAAARHRA